MGVLSENKCPMEYGKMWDLEIILITEYPCPVLHKGCLPMLSQKINSWRFMTIQLCRDMSHNIVLVYLGFL